MMTGYVFLSGAAAGLAAVIALFFFRYWRKTRDRFFVLLATSFVLLAVQWAAAAGLRDTGEAHPNVYLVRLAAFLIIVIAIVDKNRGGGGGKRVGSRPNLGSADPTGSARAGASRRAYGAARSVPISPARIATRITSRTNRTRYPRIPSV